MARFIHPLVAFAAPAVPGAGWGRTLLGGALVAAIVLALVELARRGVAATLSAGRLLGPEGSPAGLGLDAPAGVLLVLAAFLAVWPALWIVLPLVHGRSARTLFGPRGRIDWRHFRLGLGVSLAVGAAAWSPFLFDAGAGLPTRGDLGRWAIFAALALPLIFIQCAAEELTFRGYLLQQFAARSASVLGWSVTPSLLFGLAHPTGEGMIGISWFHVIFGLVMAAITSRTANLGGAIGLHFGNNVVNMLVIAPASLVSGLALVPVPEAWDVSGPRIAYLAVMFIGAALFMGVMDLRFIRAWRAQAKADRAGAPVGTVAPAGRPPRAREDGARP